jgi:hypothetical protein
LRRAHGQRFQAAVLDEIPQDTRSLGSRAGKLTTSRRPVASRVPKRSEVDAQPISILDDTGRDQARKGTPDLARSEASRLRHVVDRPCAERDRRDNAQPIFVAKEAGKGRRRHGTHDTRVNQAAAAR